MVFNDIVIKECLFNQFRYGYTVADLRGGGGGGGAGTATFRYIYIYIYITKLPNFLSEDIGSISNILLPPPPPH